MSSTTQPPGDGPPTEPAEVAPPLPDFAPTDYTDGREPLDWKSKYPDDARKQIRLEAIYLAGLLIVLPTLIIVLLSSPGARSWSLDCRSWGDGCKYFFSLIGGALGGALFATKWLYHSVAKKIWHIDRRLWRLFTPLLSAGLAFGTTLLMKANVVAIFSQQALDSPQAILAISFLVGYFSDNATAKLTEVAETVFGATREPRQSRSRNDDPPRGPGSTPPAVRR